MRRAILVAAISAVSFDAYAQDFRIGGELGLYHNTDGSESFTILTQVLDLDVTLFDTIAINAGLPFVELIGPEDSARIGNPWILGYYVLGGDVFNLRIGGGLAFPAAQLDENVVTGFLMYQYALGMYGYQSPWMYSPETLPIMVPSLRLALDFTIVTIDAGADVVILVPLNDDLGQDVEVLLPVYAGAMVHLWFLGVGATLAANILPTVDDDKIQVSLSPRITATFGPIELEARLTLNLDEPFGFAFEEGGVWGFFLGVHGVF